MISGIELFIAKAGIIALLYLAWFDLKTGKVDTRKTSFMLGGVIVGFLATQENPILLLPYLFLAYGFSLLYAKSYGTGDLGNFYWIIPLLGMLEWWYPIGFLFLLGFTTSFVILIKRWKNVIDKTPGMINLAVAYLLIVGAHFYYQLWPTGCPIELFCYYA